MPGMGQMAAEERNQLKEKKKCLLSCELCPAGPQCVGNIEKEHKVFLYRVAVINSI